VLRGDDARSCLPPVGYAEAYCRCLDDPLYYDWMDALAGSWGVISYYLTALSLAQKGRIMSHDTSLPQAALKYEVEVQEHGKLELTVPFLPGVRVAVFVVEEPNDLGDLVSAAQSSLGFWDNPFDDEDWNDATPG
jgi:hypothetical protein